MTTSAAEDGRAIVGILTKDDADYPFSVEISLRDVGGPSAGLMFALGIVDKLTPGALTNGRHVAGTGTIDDAGAVGAIGGIPQKMIGAKDAGAKVFLVPEDNCAEAVKTAPEGLRLVKVTSLKTAVAALDALAKDDDARPPGLRRLTAQSANVAPRASARVGTRSGPLSTAFSSSWDAHPQRGRARTVTQDGDHEPNLLPVRVLGHPPQRLALVVRQCLLLARRQHQPLHREGGAEHLRRPGDAREQLVERVVGGQIALVDRGEVTGRCGDDAQLAGELRLPAQQVGGLDERVEVRWLVPAAGRDVPLDVDRDLGEPRVGLRGCCMSRSCITRRRTVRRGGNSRDGSVG